MPAHLKRLVDISDVLSLHICMLSATTDQLGESCQQSFNSDSRHIDILPRDQGCMANVPLDLHGVKAVPSGVQLWKQPPLPVLVTIEAANTTIVRCSDCFEGARGQQRRLWKTVGAGCASSRRRSCFDGRRVRFCADLSRPEIPLRVRHSLNMLACFSRLCMFCAVCTDCSAE